MRPSVGLVLALAVAVSLALVGQRYGAGDGRDSSAPAERPGLSTSVGPAMRICVGVTVSTSDDLSEVVRTHPAGTTYCILPGRHRLVAPVEPRRGDAFIGQPGAVLSGSKILTGWRKSGHWWSAPGFLPLAPGDHGECLSSVSTCRYTEDVFRDEERLNRVASLADLTSGTVFADYRTNTITVGDDPNGHLMEQAVAPSLIRGTADDVTVANLVLEQAANEAQVGAVEGRQMKPYMAGARWRLLHNEVRLNHGVGLGFGSGAVVSGNFIHHQGQLGFGAWGVGSLVSNNEISYNGVAGYSWEWEAGGSKSWQTTNHKVRHNYVHHNRGPGLWTDGGNLDTDYEYNEIADNWGAGIQHELSYDATIRHNVMSRNGRKHKGWAWEAGIQVQNSGGNKLLEVAYNDVVDNANGITLIDSGDRGEDLPKPHGPHLVQNVWVHHNSVTMAAGQLTGAVEDTGDPGIFLRNHNRFESNTYYVESLNEPYFTWANSDLGWRQWRGLGNGNDLNGRAELWRR